MEWRVRTTRLASALESPEPPLRAYRVAGELFEDFAQYSQDPKQANHDLDGVCSLASDLAVLFRSNKTEYL